MSEVRDAAIKLFGRNIPVPDFPSPAEPDSAAPQAPLDEMRKVDTALMAKSCKDVPSNSEDGRENNELEGNRIPAEDQVLKRPEKILPCPRCNSLDTKFCYFNNYNVNQPRHFCKNCHRYWTAGGTMRNVPVGAGRRKNKHPSIPFRQAVVQSDGLQCEASNSVNHQHLSGVGLPDTIQGIGKVMKFSKDVHLCESMAASLNLRDPAIRAKMGSTAVGNDGEEPSSSGCFSATTSVHENELPERQIEQVSLQGLKPHMQHYPGAPQAYPWNPGWSTMMFSPDNNNSSVGSPPMMAVSSFCPPSVTIPFVPAPYWGCMPSWDGRKWNIPMVATTGAGCLSPSSSASNNCSGNNSPTLGKHSRDATLQAEEKTGQSLWVPKTLRVDDPDEAAKSSIWDTLGIKPDNIQPVKKGGILKAFQSKPKNSSDPDADHVLQANPAAFSRSQTFQENT